jgi:hypothetical protein
MGSGRGVLECHAAEEATGVRQARCGGGCSGADAGSDAGTEEVAWQRVRGRTRKGARGPVRGKKKGKWVKLSHPVFKAKTRYSSYVCPGSIYHTYGQNVTTEYQCFYHTVSYYKNYYNSRKD